MERPTLIAILLAAGSSTRMGKANKLLLPFGESLIIQNCITQLSKANIGELIIVLGHEAQKVESHLPKGIRTVINEDHLQGMTTSIQAGVQALSPNSQGIMICLADQVLMQTADYNFIIDAWMKAIGSNPDLILVPTFESQKGNPVIFSSRYKDEILSHQESNGCKDIVKRHQRNVRKLMMPNNHILKDVDTPEDYENTKIGIDKKVPLIDDTLEHKKPFILYPQQSTLIGDLTIFFKEAIDVTGFSDPEQEASDSYMEYEITLSNKVNTEESISFDSLNKDELNIKWKNYNIRVLELNYDYLKLEIEDLQLD